jgi:hypothetical protein
MTEEDKIIEQIIYSFETFAFGDIRHNIETEHPKPISAFILCSCLIDQLAAFTYYEPPKADGNPKYTNRELYKRFINEYLPHYKPLNLYVNLRCKLVHNYTIARHIQLTNDVAPYENIGLDKNINVLTAPIMFNDLKIIFETICRQYRTPGSIQRQRALECYKKNRIITHLRQKFTTYLDYEGDILINYFSQKLPELIEHSGKQYKIESINKKNLGEKRVLVYVIASHRGKKITPQIDEVIFALNLETSTHVLNTLDPTQQNIPPSDSNPI